MVTSELRLASYAELDTIYNVDDLYNMLELIEVKQEIDEIIRIKAEQNKANQ